MRGERHALRRARRGRRLVGGGEARIELPPIASKPAATTGVVQLLGDLDVGGDGWRAGLCWRAGRGGRLRAGARPAGKP